MTIPGIGGLQGKNNGRPSSIIPVNLLQMGLTPRSGLLLPTRTTIVAFRPLAANVKSHVREEVIVESEMTISSKMSAKSFQYSRLCQLTTAALAKVNPD